LPKRSTHKPLSCLCLTIEMKAVWKPFIRSAEHLPVAICSLVPNPAWIAAQISGHVQLLFLFFGKLSAEPSPPSPGAEQELANWLCAGIVRGLKSRFLLLGCGRAPPKNRVFRRRPKCCPR
jgi:hypothetical protein